MNAPECRTLTATCNAAYVTHARVYNIAWVTVYGVITYPAPEQGKFRYCSTA